MNDVQGAGASGPLRHIPALDGIRGVAIIWVVIHNATDMSYAASEGSRLLAMIGHTGWIGVQLFFALSGFLITAGLLRTQGAKNYFLGFYIKRALRILPLYYTVLLGVLVVLPRLVTLDAPFNSAHQASLWLFTVNWTHSAPYGFAHFWSLAVEEQFYLFWPLVVFALAPRRLLAVCLWIAAGALLLRCALVALNVDPSFLYTITPCRMDALALGAAGACALSVAQLREWIQRWSAAIMIAALLVFFVGIPLTHLYNRDQWPGETIGYTLLAVCSAALVTTVARAPSGVVSALLSCGALRSLGKYSYAIYVFHGLLHKLLGEPWLHGRFGEQPSARVVFLYSLVILSASYLLAFCSYHVLELPFLKLKPAVSSSSSPVLG